MPVTLEFRWLRSRLLRRAPRIFLFTALFLVVLLQIVIFSPLDLESEKVIGKIQPLDPKSLIQEIQGDAPFVAPDIPRNRIPEYRVKDFHYVSSNAGQKDWKLVAKEADFYNTVQRVHGKQVIADLYDSKNQTTIVQGREAQYNTEKRDLEVFGKVVAVFPDGMTIRSEYMRYQPENRIMFVPENYTVEGESMDEKAQKAMFFQSKGMTYHLDDREVKLLKEVHFKVEKKAPPGSQIASSDWNTIDSDHCTIQRAKNIAHFEMNPAVPIEKRFVVSRQPNLLVKSRTMDLNYGDYADVIHYMIAYDDVYIEDKSPEGVSRHATGGQADFDAKKNLIILTKYPQVYQDNDTVTGNKIIVYRETDVVEVEQSNAFSEGQQSQPKKSTQDPAGD